MSAELEDLLTIDEAATLLRTSKKVLRRRINDGEFDVVRDGRVILVPRDSLVAHLRDHLVRSLRAQTDGESGQAASRHARAEELLTPEDVARRCRLGRKAVYRAIERGELRATKICSRLRVLPQDVDAWIERGRTDGANRPDRRPSPFSQPEPAPNGLRALFAATSEAASP